MSRFFFQGVMQKAALLTLCSIFSGYINAVTLGDLHLESALDQPLMATVDLLDSNNYPFDDIVVSIATREEFSSVGVRRLALLDKVKMLNRVSAQGERVVQLTTQEPVNELMMTLLLRLDAGGETELKKYTLLLLGLPSPSYSSREPSIKNTSAEAKASDGLDQKAGGKSNEKFARRMQSFANSQTFRGATDLGVLTLGEDSGNRLFAEDPFAAKIKLFDLRLDNTDEQLLQQNTKVNGLAKEMLALRNIVQRQNKVLANVQASTSSVHLSGRINGLIAEFNEQAEPELQTKIEGAIESNIQARKEALLNLNVRENPWLVGFLVLLLSLFWFNYHHRRNKRLTGQRMMLEHKTAQDSAISEAQKVSSSGQQSMVKSSQLTSLSKKLSITEPEADNIKMDNEDVIGKQTEQANSGQGLAAKDLVTRRKPGLSSPFIRAEPAMEIGLMPSLTKPNEEDFSEAIAQLGSGTLLHAEAGTLIWQPKETDGTDGAWKISDFLTAQPNPSSKDSKQEPLQDSMQDQDLQENELQLLTEVPATPLELVQAYIELADLAGAQRIIDGITETGNKRELEQAMNLLRDMA